MGDWDTTPVPEREWGVCGRFPLRQPSLLSGEGAVGKSIIELQLCVAPVLGRDWLGAAATQGPAIYCGCEDEPDELRRRLTAIARHYGATFAELIAAGLHVLSFVDDDPLLGVPEGTIIVPTSRFDQLLEAAHDIRPKHIGIDTAADVFGGNENDRAQVRQFVSMLRKLARAANGSVILLSHPSLTGISTGSGLSGSTGWHNSMRARAYLRPPKSVEGEQPDSDMREIEFKKNNYGRVSESIALRWQDGLFLPTAAGTFDRAVRDQNVEEAFVAALRKLIGQGHNASPYPGSTYAPALVAPLAPEFRKQDYAAAMQRLLNAGRVRVEQFGSPSKKRSRVVLVEEQREIPF